MGSPISIRCDLPFQRRRMTVDEERVVVESGDMVIGTWSTERALYFDQVELVYRYRRPVRRYLAGVFAALPFLAAGVVSLPSAGGIVLLAFGVLIGWVSLLAGLVPRPWLKLRARGVEDVDVRMDRPLLRRARRRAFFRTIFEALGLDVPPELQG